MRAVLLALAGFFSFTLMDLSVKWLLQDYSLLQVIFFNGLFALLGLLLWIMPNPRVLKTRRPGLHLFRAAMLLVIDALAFYSYGQVPLAEAYTLILTMPLFTALLAMLWRYETHDLRRLSLVLAGFAGVCIVLSPTFGHFNPALLAALASAMIEAFSFIMVVKHKSHEHPLAFAFYGMALMVIVAGGLLVLKEIQLLDGLAIAADWRQEGVFTQFSAKALLISAAGGLCYAVATYFVLSAFHRGSPTTVSSMQYSQLVWGMLLGAMIWQEWPAPAALVGGTLIVISGLSLLRREARRLETALE